MLRSMEAVTVGSFCPLRQRVVCKMEPTRTLLHVCEGGVQDRVDKDLVACMRELAIHTKGPKGLEANAALQHPLVVID